MSAGSIKAPNLPGVLLVITAMSFNYGCATDSHAAQGAAKGAGTGALAGAVGAAHA